MPLTEYALLAFSSLFVIVDPIATEYPFAYPAEFEEELGPYLKVEPAGPRLAAFLERRGRGH